MGSDGVLVESELVLEVDERSPECFGFGVGGDGGEFHGIAEAFGVDSEAMDFCGGRVRFGFSAGLEEFLVERLDQFREGDSWWWRGRGEGGVLCFQVLEEGLAARGLQGFLHMAAGVVSGAVELLLELAVWLRGRGVFEECESLLGEDIGIPGGAQILGEPFEFRLQLEGCVGQQGFEEADGGAEASACDTDLMDGLGGFLEAGNGDVGEEAGGFPAEDFLSQLEEWGAVFFARFHLGERTPQCSPTGDWSAKG